MKSVSSSIIHTGSGLTLSTGPSNLKGELVEGPVERVSREEVLKAIREMKVGKTAGPSEVSAVQNDSGKWGDWDWCDGRAVSGCVGWKRKA